jgi:hypothetical protein
VGKRKRRTKAEMAALKEAQETNGKVVEKVENGEIDTKDLIFAALPKEKNKEYVYIDKEVPVIKELRILKDKQGTELSVTEIIKQELDLVNAWEYKNVPINEINLPELKRLGKEGWKFAFDLSPDVTTAVKIITLIFQRPVYK